MEKIELVVTHQAGAPADCVCSAIFGMAGGTIGRSGQNKLVLPDTDAEVARVHAMVRLDSDQAYLANLCERRTVQVNGIEVLSGEEVPLGQGSEIIIGSYRILATVPGAHQSSMSQTDAQSASFQVGGGYLSQTPPATLPLSPLSPHASNLASLPNPWADIPPIVGGEAAIPELAHVHTSTTITRVADDSAMHANDDPFAMLGRVEPSPLLTTDVSGTVPPPPVEIPFAEGFAPESNVTARFTTANPQAPGNVQPHVAASKPQAHRAMVIPDDFDPFAADPKVAASQQDAWSGDLAAKSLSEVAPLKNDELLQSLPQTSHFAGDMDNAAHTGLPKQLDPHVELNPLKLFREPGESMYMDAVDHGLAHGSDLAQVFSMPRGASNAIPSLSRTAEAGHAAASESSSTIGHASVESQKARELAQAAGLQTMQGLDLDLFGTAAADTTATESSYELRTQESQSTTGVDDTATTQHAPDISSPTSYPAQHPAVATARPGGTGASLSHATLKASCAPEHHESVHNMQALAAAFLEGAGLAPDRVSIVITPEFMREFGEVLRVAVQGSIDLLSARSEIKREFRADVTIIASGKNNPLKFLPTAEGVMLQLAGQSFPGFMPPVAAVQEAFNDLAVHQIALMAGIRAAYAEAVTSLSPSEIEKRSSRSNSVLSKLSTLHRKAALWDEYQQKYDSIRQHAEDDLMAFSGHTFVQAYENAAKSAGGTP